jgi:hypothetical protein
MERKESHLKSLASTREARRVREGVERAKNDRDRKIREVANRKAFVHRKILEYNLEREERMREEERGYGKNDTRISDIGSHIENPIHISDDEEDEEEVKITSVKGKFIYNNMYLSGCAGRCVGGDFRRLVKPDMYI